MDYTNTIKPNRDITIVRYQDGNTYDAFHNAFYAALSSHGGIYNGVIDDNPNDPEGQGGPRKFLMGNFQGVTMDLVNQVVETTSCDYLTVINNEFCLGALITWRVFDGGEIMAGSTGTSIRTNGLGRYEATISCPDGCTYIADYTFVEEEENSTNAMAIDPVLSSILDNVVLGYRNKTLPDGTVQTPHERELDIPLEAPSITKEEIAISPNPTSGLVLIQNVMIGDAYVVLDNVGRTVLSGLIASTMTIDMTDINPGIYYLKVNSEKETQTAKFIKI